MCKKPIKVSPDGYVSEIAEPLIARNKTIDECNAYFISRLEEILMLKYTLHDCFKAIEKLIAELRGEGK